VRSGRRDDERALGLQLPAHIGKIQGHVAPEPFIPAPRAAVRQGAGRRGRGAGKVRTHLEQVTRGTHPSRCQASAALARGTTSS